MALSYLICDNNRLQSPGFISLATPKARRKYVVESSHERAVNAQAVTDFSEMCDGGARAGSSAGRRARWARFTPCRRFDRTQAVRFNAQHPIFFWSVAPRAGSSIRRFVGR